METLKDDILQLNIHTFIGSWAQFEELHKPFVNLKAYLPPKHNSPYNESSKLFYYVNIYLYKIHNLINKENIYTCL